VTAITVALGCLFAYLVLAPAPTYDVQPAVVRWEARPPGPL
jgi:hypothetical protein